MYKMRSTNWLFFFVLIVITSCEKSYAPDGVIPPVGNTNGTVLVKAVSTGASTETNEYEYDENGRLIKSISSGQANAATAIFHRLVRDGNGKIIRIVTNELAGGNLGSDSISINVHYPAGSSNFDYSVSSYLFGGFTKTDSSVYIYTNGKITDTYDYQSFSAIPNSPAQFSRTSYTYNAQGNLGTIKIYAPLTSPSNLDLVSTITYEYDDKVSPLQLGNEAFLGINPEFSSKNNGVKATMVDHTGTVPTFSIIQTFQYNANNLPIAGTTTETRGNTTSTVQYFYK